MPDPGVTVSAPQASIYGCAGLTFDDWERGFFAEQDPFGFILFQRNCDNPEQVRRLVEAFRDAVGRADAPVLIDQEGGRVARLKPPHWQTLPPAGAIGGLAERDPEAGAEAAWLQARLIAADLEPLGITVDCAPVLDLRHSGAHDVIGDRAFGGDPELVARLGRAFCDGLLAGGVLPVIKHMPGHGRTLVDSHLKMPVVEAPLEALEQSDFQPFQSLADMPLGMTGHLCLTSVDEACPATISSRVQREVIRGSLGFQGLLLTDDLSMSALPGGLGERAAAALAAGCDVALHCNGEREEMQQVAGAVGPLSAAGQERWAAALARLDGPLEPVDASALRRRLDALVPAL